MQVLWQLRLEPKTPGVDVSARDRASQRCSARSGRAPRGGGGGGGCRRELSRAGSPSADRTEGIVVAAAVSRGYPELTERRTTTAGELPGMMKQRMLGKRVKR